MADELDAEVVGKRAKELFLAKHNCAEAVLTASMERLGVEGEWFPAVASGFGAGLGRSGIICGAVTGAVMAAGARRGRGTPDEDLDALDAFALALVRGFEDEFGTTRCIELIGLDVSTPEGLARARADGIFEDTCPKFVGFCAERVAGFLPRGPQAASG